jgi:HK97 family phage major capsid protein
VSIERLQDEGVLPQDDDLGKLLARAGEIKDALDEDRSDRAELKQQYAEVKADIDKWQKAQNDAADKAAMRAEIDDMVKSAMASYRTPSKAHLIGTGKAAPAPREDLFLTTVAYARGPRAFGDHRSEAAKADLAELGSRWADKPADSKATLGDSDGAGGYLVPNNVVSEIVLQAQPVRSIANLFTIIDDVRGSAVDIPWEDTADSRAVIAAAGATKENSNFIVNNYTATLYTLARIFDVGNQLLRHSQGAAERLVRSKLQRAFGLGIDYYVIQGSGSSQPYGLLTALGTSGTYVTSHTPSASTVAGNWAAGAAKAAAAVAQRGADPNGALVNSSDYWIMLTYGADAAGFYVDPNEGGLGFRATAPGQVGAGPWGMRLAHSPNMPSDSLVVGDFKAATVFLGQDFRIDTSSEAGDRWDKNLTGFRGEMELAFDARPFVYTGLFQRITDIKA